MITEIEIHPVTPKKGLVGFASFIYNDELFIGSVAIYTRIGGGYRLAYPTKSGIHTCRPLNKEIGNAIEKAVTDKYTQLLSDEIYGE